MSLLAFPPLGIMPFFLDAETTKMHATIELKTSLGTYSSSDVRPCNMN